MQINQSIDQSKETFWKWGRIPDDDTKWKEITQKNVAREKIGKLITEFLEKHYV